MFRVLVLEDRLAIREVISTVLERRGFSVQAVSSEDAARRSMQSGAVDVMVCDFGIPARLGGPAGRGLQQLAPECPVLYISGSFDPQETPAEPMPGPFGWEGRLAKPFSAQQLTGALFRLIRWQTEEPLPRQVRMDQ